jgi:hypothetical protein
VLVDIDVVFGVRPVIALSVNPTLSWLSPAILDTLPATQPLGRFGQDGSIWNTGTASTRAGRVTA